MEEHDRTSELGVLGVFVSIRYEDVGTEPLHAVIYFRYKILQRSKHSQPGNGNFIIGMNFIFVDFIDV